MPEGHSLDAVLNAIDDLKDKIHKNYSAPEDRRARAEDFLDAVKDLLKAYCRRGGSYYEWDHLSGYTGEHN